MMNYKGYSAVVEFDADAGVLHGEVANLGDVITFEATSVNELRREFQASVDDYLEFCREQGRAPEKPYSGRFVVRMPPELHRKVAMTAADSGVSMNSWVVAACEVALPTIPSSCESRRPAPSPSSTGTRS